MTIEELDPVMPEAMIKTRNTKNNDKEVEEWPSFGRTCQLKKPVDNLLLQSARNFLVSALRTRPVL